jgi:hypothetical protein
LPCDRHFGVLEKMQRRREKAEFYEEWMEISSKEFSVVEVKGFMIKDFATGLGVPFVKKVESHKGLKFKITECKMFVFKRE